MTGRTAAVAFIEPDLLMLRLSRGRWRLELTLALDRGQHIASVEVGEGGMNVRVDEADGSPGYAWATNARIADHSIDDHPAHDPIVSVELDADSEAALFVGRGDAAERTRQPCRPDEVLDAAATRWARLLDRVPSVGAGESEPLLRAAWTLATNTVLLALDELATPAVVPSKMGYVALWQWDAYFHAIGLRHLDLGMAREQLRLALRWQTTDGMLPDLVHDEGVVAMSDDMEAADRQRSLLHIGRKSTSEQQRFLSAPLTKPPLTAWAAWKLFEIDQDSSFLAEVYPPIVRSHRWWFERSRPPGFDLPIYLHPYSSGIDDSPLWDLGMPVETPDLPAYLALQADHLALMAAALGDDVAASSWRSEAARTTDALVARHWDPASGSFLSLHDGVPLRSDTAIGLLPLVTGRLPHDISTRLVETLLDRERFWTTYPVPSVALRDPDFDPTRMWRGPTWLFVDYLIVDGLRRSGFSEASRTLAERAMRMVEQGTGMPEFYHPLTGARPEMASATFSGTAALYVDLLLGLVE